MNHHTGDSQTISASHRETESGGAIAAAVSSAVGSGVKVGTRSASSSEGITSRDSIPPRVTIVIPVYNQAELTEKCLYAVAANTGVEPDYEVVVVDNGSTDWTMYLLHAMEGDIDVVSNDANLGFAAACNQGAESQTSDYILFLNNDTVPREHWLEAMVELADSDPTIGIVGAKLLYPGTGKIQHAGLIMKGDTPEHIFRGVDQNDPRVLVGARSRHGDRHLPPRAQGDFRRARRF